MRFETNILETANGHIIELKDTASGTFAQVFAFGAILNSFSIQFNNEKLNVIDGFASLAEAQTHIAPMFNGAKLSPFVCRTKNEKYHFGESSYHLSKYSMGKHAIHGLIFDATFSIVETTNDADGACVKLQHVYDNDAEGYPFCYRCQVDYQLKANNELTVMTAITNIDDQLLPIADGWHPYFTLGDKVDECQLEFQSKEMLAFDEGLIPTGKLLPYQEFGSLKVLGATQFDNCFTVNFAECQPMCVFRNPKRQVQVEIHPSREYPYLQLFTPGHRQSIAIENLSAAPDAFNNAMGLRVIEPQEQAIFTTKYIIRKL